MHFRAPRCCGFLLLLFVLIAHISIRTPHNKQLRSFIIENEVHLFIRWHLSVNFNHHGSYSVRTISNFTKHGYNCILLTNGFRKESFTDITLCMDVERNPGPGYQTVESQNRHGIIRNYDASMHLIKYSRSTLLGLRDNSLPMNCTLDNLAFLKINNIFKYRGKRAGRNNFIPTRITCRRIIKDSTNFNLNLEKRPNLIKRPNIININLNKDKSQRNSPSSKVTLGLWNAQSMKNKIPFIIDTVLSRNFDLLTITETWMTGTAADDKPMADLKNALPDYDFFHIPRMFRGGGVGVLLRKGFHCKMNDVLTLSGLEYMDISISSISKSSLPMKLIVIYRTPPSKKNKLTSSIFFHSFSTLLEHLIASPAKLVIVGDFNFHLDIPTENDVMVFSEMLHSSNLSQFVTEPTHRCGHILDLLITRSDDSLISDVRVSHESPSDHYLVYCRMNIAKPKRTKLVVSSRKLQSINLDAFCGEIKNSDLFLDPSLDLSQKCDNYNNCLSTILDKHAPLCKRSITLRPRTQWYTDELRLLKQDKRRAERKWKATKLMVHKLIFKDLLKQYWKLLEESKTQYHKSKILDCDQRQLFKLVDNIVRPDFQKSILPNHTCADALANDFADFFEGKIYKLRLSFPKCDLTHVAERYQCCCSLDHFHPVTTNELESIIKRSPSKSCDIDPLPTSLLKACLEPLVSTILDIVNSSLILGLVPSSLKAAQVRPLIKKSSLDQNILANYRPISNLPFLSKVLEKTVAYQLNEYLVSNSLLTKNQSGYRKFHSTESALLRVFNDLLLALDSKKEAVLVLLDMSAAFDTIDHSILLNRLSSRFGISGKALDWFKSYLQDRSQTVVIGRTSSHKHNLLYGVPQGSVLGPVLFTLYISPMEDIVNSHGLNSMFYADDSQIYIIIERNQHMDAIAKLQYCIADLKQWLLANKLVFNDSKTEIVHLTSRFIRTRETLPNLIIGSAEISSSPKARDLGVIVDQHLDLGAHITKLCSSASVGLRKIGQIRKYLTKEQTERLVHAFISSRLDACNSLFYCLPDLHLNKLQRIQNTAARIISLSKPRNHITPVLFKLHWLPVKQRIKYKILLFTFKALHALSPGYITELVSQYTQERFLRSENKNLLQIPKYSTSSYGKRAFSVAAPTLWNSLPLTIKQCDSVETFKKSLKTHLFKEYFY